MLQISSLMMMSWPRRDNEMTSRRYDDRANEKGDSEDEDGVHFGPGVDDWVRSMYGFSWYESRTGWRVDGMVRGGFMLLYGFAVGLIWRDHKFDEEGRGM